MFGQTAGPLILNNIIVDRLKTDNRQTMWASSEYGRHKG